MGFIEDKKETINNVALFEVLGDLPKARSTSSLSSVVSKSKNLLPFLIDLLSTTCKDNSKKTNTSNTANTTKSRVKCESTRILTEILIMFFPSLLRILKEGIVKGVKSALACGSDFIIPNPTPQFTINIKTVDLLGIIKLDPNDSTGKFFYGRSVDTDFNWFLYDLVQSNGSGSWKNILDVSSLTNNGETLLTVKINNSYAGKSFDKFLLDYTNSNELLTQEGLMVKSTNLLTNAMGAGIFSVDTLSDLEKINTIQDKINDTDACKEDYVVDDSYFTFSNEENLEIENTANNLVRGFNTLDLGCGLVESSVPKVLVGSIFDTIRDASPSEIDNTITSSVNALNDGLTSNVDDKDKKLAQLNLNVKLIEAIPKILTNVILEPKIVILYHVSSKTVNDTVTNVTNSLDYVKVTKVFFEFVARESLAALLEIVYKLVKKEIMLLVGRTVAKIAKDQSKLRLKQLTFLTGGLIEGALAAVPTPDVSKFT